MLKNNRKKGNPRCYLYDLSLSALPVYSAKCSELETGYMDKKATHYFCFFVFKPKW